MNVTRTPWRPFFPDVVVHARLEDRDSHPAYLAAKAGDPTSAAELVRDLFSPDALNELKQLVGENTVCLAAVSALEDSGFNAIPDALANELASRAGWQLDLGEIRQTNKVSHTRAGGWHRLITQATFAGQVQPGASYILVDDHVGFGGTLANMRGYIEMAGGRVLAMTTLTQTVGAKTIALRAETLAHLQNQHGSALEDVWKTTFGYGLELCTELEAGYLDRQRSVDFIRRCLAKAAKKANQRALSAIEIPEPS